MASTQNNLCSICELQHKTTAADEWCPECEEFLCSICKVHHSLAKMTKNHKTVKMSDVQYLPSFVLEMKTDCAEHNQKLEFFCPKHEVPFCIMCTPKHQDCGEITVIRQVTDIKSQQFMANIEQNLQDLREGIDTIYNDRKKNLSLLTEQEKKWRREIREIKNKINEKLDKLEKAILDELKDICVHQKEEIENFMKDLNDHKVKADKLQDDIVKIKQHASGIQTFLSVLQIQEILQKEDVYMTSVMTDTRSFPIEISFSENPECSNGEILSSLGKLTIVTNRCSIPFKKQKDKQAQLLIPLVRNIGRLRVNKTINVDISSISIEANIVGCTTTEDGRILLADNGNYQIIVLSPDGVLICGISFNVAPKRIVHTKGITFVSSYIGKSVIRLDIKRKIITKEINFKRNCNALSASEDKIIIQIEDREYKILDFNLIEVGRIPISKSYCPYLSCFNEKLYFACSTENVVYCYDMEGKVVWEFTDPKLKSPHGIGIDGNGNVFVSGRLSHNILVISPNGNESRELVDLKDILEDPMSVDYNRQRRKLLVSSTKRVVQFDVL